MGFNLRQKLEETFADINPFDNGATAQTVRANRVKAQPAQTVKTQTQSRPIVQQSRPTYQNPSLYTVQAQVPTLNFNNSMPKAQVFGSSDPLKMGQVKSPQLSLAQPAKPVQYTAPTQPSAPKVYTPKAQQAYVDAEIIGTGSPDEVKQALTRTVDRKNSVKLDPQFKQGKSYEDIARDAGFSIDEVKRYAERNHKGYGDQGLLGNAVRATGQFVGGMVKNGTNIIARPFTDLGDFDYSRGEAELQQINRDYRSGNITPAAAMERANALAGRYTTQKATFGDDGYIRIGSQSPVEFTGNIAQQGIDSASLLPVGGGVASGSARIASAVGEKTTANTLNKAASIMTAGAQTQATSKLANALTARGMNPQTANLVGNAITSNAKQSLVYGTAQTGADVASGRGITPESLAMNYGADFLMGAVPEIGLGSIGRGIDLNNAKVHQELIRTNPIYKANTDKLAAIDATIAQAQANGDVRALEGLEAVRAQLSQNNALIARRYSENGFLGGKNATGFKDAEARGEVFDGVDGKPRFEVDDSGAKIKNPNGNTLGELVDHPELFNNYPELKDVKVKFTKMDSNGEFDPKTNTITINPDRDMGAQLGTILHESQHKIQSMEGFASGGSTFEGLVDNQNAQAAKLRQRITALQKQLRGVADPERKKILNEMDKLEVEAIGLDMDDSFDRYRRLAGEAEARAVQARMDMPMSERYVKPEGRTLYHGSPVADTIKQDGFKSGKGNALLGEGVYLTPSRNKAGNYTIPRDYDYSKPITEEMRNKGIIEAKIAQNAKIFTPKTRAELKTPDTNYGDPKLITEKFKKLGYDGIELNGEVVIFDPSKVSVAGNPRSTFYDSLDVPKEDLIVRNEGAKDQPATKSANQTKSLPEPSKTPVQPKPTPALEAQQPQTSSSQVSGRATKSKSKIRAPKEPQPVQKAVIETNLKESSSYTSKVSEKPKIVKEERRAIKQGATETYGLRDSFDNSPNVPPELKESLGAFGNSRTVKTNKELWNDAQARMQDPAEAMKFFNENNTDDAVATGYALINNYMKRGNTKEAGDIAMIMAERALESGRQTQAYSMMKKLTPEGSVAYVARRVNKYLNDNPKMAEKVKWNDEVQKKLYGLAEEVNKLPEGRERNLKIGEMQELINNIFPSSLADKAITVWKAGLLTSLRTHERNLVGNTINLASEQIASAPASLADRLMSLRTKERTIVASMGEGLGTGAGYGARLAKDQLKTGIDVTNSNLKMDMNHVTWGDSKVEKFFKVYTDGVFRTLGAEDKLFREAAHKNSLVNQAMAQAQTKKLKGNAYDDYVREKVANPTAKMLELANEDAGRATFTHDNVLGDIIKHAKQAARKSKYGKVPAAVLDFLVPFTQVPSGVASQLYAYSPAKLVKSMYDIGKVLITKDSGLQRTAAQGFGRSVIGTSVLGAGAYMMSQGLMTGQPEDDAERAQWEAEGKMANSIKVGDRWYQLGSIGPQTLLLLAGAQAVKDKQNGRDPMVTTAGNLGKNFKDQTFLKGMNSALDAIDDPKRYGDSFVESSATSSVPNIVKDVAKATDPNAREAIGTTDKFKASIPGMSQSLPKQRDSYGQEIKNQGIRHMLDLFNSKKEKDLPESSYIDALRSSTGEKDHVPTIADKSIKINGETKKLTSSEYEQYQKYIGQKGKEYIAEAMNNAEFKARSPNEQVNKIDKALKDINAAAKAELFGNVRKDGKVSADVREVVTTGKLSVDSSITKAKGVKGTPKEKYETALKDYQAKKKDMSEAQRFKKEKELATLKVKSNFDKDVVDLWGMSKADIYGLLTKDKDGNRKANELIKLDQAMYDAGLTKYLTFKNGIAPAQRGGTKRASTGRKGTGSRGGRARSAKGKFDYKLFGFSGSGGTSNSKQLHDLLKRAQLKVQK